MNGRKEGRQEGRVLESFLSDVSRLNKYVEKNSEKLFQVVWQMIMMVYDVQGHHGGGGGGRGRRGGGERREVSLGKARHSARNG